MLFYQTFGPPPLKHPLIFLHGFLGNSQDWIPIVDELKSSFSCTLLDLPAHGKSPYKDPAFNTIESFLSRWDRPILIGYSLGGRISFRYASKHPRNVKAVLALSSHLGLVDVKEQRKRKAHDLEWAHQLRTLSSDRFLSLWYEQKGFASLKKRPDLLRRIIETRDVKNKGDLAHLLIEFSLSEQPFYGDLKTQVALLCGEEDEAYESLYAKAPYPHQNILGAGHSLLFENPKASAEWIQKTLGSFELF